MTGGWHTFYFLIHSTTEREFCYLNKEDCYYIIKLKEQSKQRRVFYCNDSTVLYGFSHWSKKQGNLWIPSFLGGELLNSKTNMDCIDANGKMFIFPLHTWLYHLHVLMENCGFFLANRESCWLHFWWTVSCLIFRLAFSCREACCPALTFPF